jgi:endonuclease III-like uncharacterized protein
MSTIKKKIANKFSKVSGAVQEDYQKKLAEYKGVNWKLQESKDSILVYTNKTVDF